MLLNNNDIYTIAINLQKFLADKENLPIKLAFYFLKNKNLIVEKAKEINELKEKIGAKYGTLNEETGAYTISQENLEPAQMELNELLSIE
jgi:hypothetical protein